MRRLAYLMIIALWGMASTVLAGDESILGRWQAQEDGKPKSVIEVYLDGDKVFGRVVDLYLKPTEAEPVCSKCDGERKGQPIRGMQILHTLEAKGDRWVNGRVFSPERNQEFDCELWREGDTLKLKASWGFISQTETWYLEP